MRLSFVSRCFVSTLLVLSAHAHATSARYIVRMKGGAVGDSSAKRLVRSLNARALSAELNSTLDDTRTTALSRLGLVVISGDESQIQSALKNHPAVELYERDVSWKVQDTIDNSQSPSSDALAPWMNDVLGFESGDADGLVTYDGNQAVPVAVIDTGANLSHPYLSPGLWTNAAEADGTPGVDDDHNGYVDDIHGANVFSGDGDVREGGMDHGSHVSGIVKSVRDRALADTPEARRVVVMPIRFISSSGVGSTSGAVEALEYALKNGARVVNASWGARGEDAYSTILYETMVDLYNDDIFFAVAAGNAEGGVANDNDRTPYYPANFPIPSLASVASITPVYGSSGSYRDFFLSSFSNYGRDTVSIAAPGDFVDSRGATGIWSANAAYPTSALYNRKRGTSMASPVVAGVAAVVRAINPSLTNYEVKQLLEDSAETSSRLASSVSSAGIVSAQRAFAAARTATSRGLRPAAPRATSSSSGDDSTTAEKRGGACGTVRGVNPNEGWWGGNSLGLLSAIFVARTLVRDLKRRLTRKLRLT